MREKEERGCSPPVPPDTQPDNSSPTALKAKSEKPCQSLPKQNPGVQADACDVGRPSSVFQPPSPPPPPSPTPKKSFKEIACSSEIVSHEILEVVPVQRMKVPFAEVKPQHCHGDDVFIPISENYYRDLVEPWKDAIICKVVGKSFSHDFLKKELQKVWKWKTIVNLTSLGKGFYSLNCGSAHEKARLLAEGPWFVMGSLLWVQSWQAGFKPSSATISHYPIWISLPELPMEFFCKDILQSIGNALGSTVKIDAHSLEGDRKRFASVCVLMRKSSCVPGRVWVGETCQDLVYSESPWLCHKCRMVGHNVKGCPEMQPEATSVPNTSVAEGCNQITEKLHDHAWMDVKERKQQKRKVDLDKRKVGRAISKSRWRPRKEREKVNDDEREKRSMDGTNPITYTHTPNVEGDLKNLPKDGNQFAALQFLQEENPTLPAMASKNGLQKDFAGKIQAQDSLNTFKETLLEWNHATFGNIYRRKRHLLARLKGTQIYLQSHPMSVFHQDLESNLQSDLIQTLDQEELLWKTKSRMDRVGEGDRNTGFFHKSVIIKRNASRINRLRDNVGNEITDQRGIHDLILAFYQDLYSTEKLACVWNQSEGASMTSNVGGDQEDGRCGLKRQNLIGYEEEKRRRTEGSARGLTPATRDDGAQVRCLVRQRSVAGVQSSC
ncbi:hypothetical protein BVRB_4g094810 [Beta vulgaris subsp. vulgaris]|nr:hypothetical protein BVRB_4g094810 [Beta vulgaris subsp. vulgaris]